MKPNKLTEITRYLGVFLFPSRYYAKKAHQQEANDVVITLTTLPSRIKNMASTIASLSDQTVRPSKILINIPSFSKREKKGYEIPDFLLNHPLVEINETEDDLGPATKLLPALKKYWGRDDIQFIVADDDEIYARQLVENYLKYSDLSNNSVLTMVGWKVPPSGDHHKRQVMFGAIGDKPKGSVEVSEPTQVDCVQGASTFMVRPTFFSEKVFDYSSAPREAFFVDDIYVSGRLAENKVDIYVIPAPFRFARMKVSTHLLLSETLHKKENKTGHNNNTLYAHFKSVWRAL